MTKVASAPKTSRVKTSANTTTADNTTKKTSPSKQAAYARYKQRQELIKAGQPIPAELQKKSGGHIGRRSIDESKLDAVGLAKLERLREIKKIASSECVARKKAVMQYGFVPAEHLPKKFKEEKFNIGQYIGQNKIEGGTSKISLVRVAPAEGQTGFTYKLCKEFIPARNNKDAQKTKDLIDIKGGLSAAVARFEKEYKSLMK
jgi:hypothetical protein